jgi:hypothetical protein
MENDLSAKVKSRSENLSRDKLWTIFNKNNVRVSGPDPIPQKHKREFVEIQCIMTDQASG